MHCYSGPFPKLLMTWAALNPGAPSLIGVDIRETIKVTGDYAIFRSRATAGEDRNNPNADVIFTINLPRGDPMKQILNRVLNACFLLYSPFLVEFLFRFLRHLIMNSFQRFAYDLPVDIVLSEFYEQFRREYGFDASMQLVRRSDFDLVTEWQGIYPWVSDYELRYPVLQAWIRP